MKKYKKILNFISIVIFLYTWALTCTFIALKYNIFELKDKDMSNLLTFIFIFIYVGPIAFFILIMTQEKIERKRILKIVTKFLFKLFLSLIITAIISIIIYFAFNRKNFLY